MLQLTDKNFNDEITKSDIPVVVDFWAEWCMPCKMLNPIIQELSKDYDGKVKFAKLNVEEGQAIASNFGVMSIPTVIIFQKGKIKDQVVGLVAKDVLKKKINSVL